LNEFCEEFGSNCIIMIIKKLLIFGVSILFFSQILSAKEADIDKWDINFQTNINKSKAEWTWTPFATFTIYGPIASSSQASVEYTLPSGKTWLKAVCDDFGRNIPADSFSTILNCGLNTSGGSETNAIGTFGFKILLTDELSGKNQTLYSGKFKVGKQLHNPKKYPQNNRNFYYYIDRDFQLPYSYVGYWNLSFAQVLYCQTWLKGQVRDESKLRAYLYFNGTLIEESQGSEVVKSESYDVDTFNYGLYGFKFDVLTAEPKPGNVEAWHKLYKNPGEYEFKLLREGKLSRIIKFSVNKNGQIIDTKIGNGQGFNGVFPAKIVGDGDGISNNSAWQEGWWGNTITGFAPINN
jgi:hypothetical protein